MIPKTRIVIASLAVFVSMLACAALLGEDPYDGDESDPPYERAEPPAEQQSPVESGEQMFCPAITRQIAELAAYESEGDEDILDEELVLVTYTVKDDDLFDPVYETVPEEYRQGQEDAFTHQQIWEYFTSLIPADQRGIIAQFSIATDGLGGTLASVAQTDFDPDSWILYVDVADTINDYEFTYTLVHEFAHILTLGPQQVTPSLAVFNNPDDEDVYFRELSACPNYFPGEGCARSDSYIHLFYYEFWDELHQEWSEINLEEDDDTYYDLLDEFYKKYQDRFVNSYAATNPEEDIAESFSFFVFSPKPGGDTVAEEKILFFYRYPEMIELRAEILNAVCANFPK